MQEEGPLSKWHCIPTAFSNTLDKIGSIEIGRSSFIKAGLTTLGIGETLAISHFLYDRLIELFMMCVSGSARCSATSFTNLAGMVSAPVEQSERKDLMHSRTSLRVTVWMVNCCVFSGISGRLSMMLARVSNDVAGAPIVCCAMVEKCTFSLSGSIRRGLGLGLRIRWITRQISNGFFDDRAFSINDLIEKHTGVGTAVFNSFAAWSGIAFFLLKIQMLYSLCESLIFSLSLF